MKRIFFYIYFIVNVILLFISCREDIIVPENIATNVNEPILQNESNSYSLSGVNIGPKWRIHQSMKKIDDAMNGDGLSVSLLLRDEKFTDSLDLLLQETPRKIRR